MGYNIQNKSFSTAETRSVVALIVGLIIGILIALFISRQYAPLAGWDSAALVFLFSTWITLRNLTTEQTAQLAIIEDPGRTTTDTILVLASVASLAAVGVLLFQSSHSSGLTEVLQAGMVIVSVIVSWTIVHTLYALRYARMFYTHNGGIDFNENTPPHYSDFVYLAFTVGMTFQVSDTVFVKSHFRRVALKHALLSYIFGTVIVASIINLVLGLSK